MMKYEKPYITVEKFQLDTTVATCSSEGGIALNYNDTACALSDPIVSASGYFSDGQCDDDAVYPNYGSEGSDQYDNACYHAQLASLKLFAS